MPLNPPAEVRNLTRKLERLLELQGKLVNSMDLIVNRLNRLETRVANIEAQELTAAPAEPTDPILADAIARITVLEERTIQLPANQASPDD